MAYFYAAVWPDFAPPLTVVLFKARSDFLHGQVMQDIPSQVRLDTRRLARRAPEEPGVPLAGDAVEDFEASYGYEEENNLPHVVDGRLATSAGSFDELLTDIVNATPSSWKSLSYALHARTAVQR